MVSNSVSVEPRSTVAEVSLHGMTHAQDRSTQIDCHLVEQSTSQDFMFLLPRASTFQAWGKTLSSFSNALTSGLRQLTQGGGAGKWWGMDHSLISPDFLFPWEEEKSYLGYHIYYLHHQICLVSLWQSSLGKKAGIWNNVEKWMYSFEDFPHPCSLLAHTAMCVMKSTQGTPWASLSFLDDH